ncbi:hypothetical protein, partial [uncultured Intestinimonas sp.]|uniref:hypothetical protein n=1 Tax=uncultured Intestinimonas sp. TaxID=1689265 RepID=UPI0025DC8CCF
ISFSAEKETGLDSKEKMGSGLRGVSTRKTAAYGFTLSLWTTPGRYGHPMVEEGKICGSIHLPPGCSTLAAGCRSGPSAKLEEH